MIRSIPISLSARTEEAMAAHFSNIEYIIFLPSRKRLTSYLLFKISPFPFFLPLRLRKLETSLQIAYS